MGGGAVFGDLPSADTTILTIYMLFSLRDQGHFCDNLYQTASQIQHDKIPSL